MMNQAASKSVVMLLTQGFLPSPWPSGRCGEQWESLCTTLLPVYKELCCAAFTLTLIFSLFWAFSIGIFSAQWTGCRTVILHSHPLTVLLWKSSGRQILPQQNYLHSLLVYYYFFIFQIIKYIQAMQCYHALEQSVTVNLHILTPSFNINRYRKLNKEIYNKLTVIRICLASFLLAKPNNS